MFRARMALVEQTVQEFVADPKQVAGIEGEMLAAACIRDSLAARAYEARLFASLRVPRRNQTGRYEIDFILLTPQLLLVCEVKHWSARTDQKGVQEPLSLTQQKADALQDWLQRRGCQISSKQIQSLVIFTHEGFELRGEHATHPSLVRLEQLPHRLHQLLQTPQASASTGLDFAGLKSQLKRLPTWDEVHLHGGQVLRGDFWSLVVAHSGQEKLFLQRHNLSECEITCPRSLWQSFYKRPRITLKDWSGRSQVIRFQSNSHLLFQPVGQSQRQQLSLLHIEQLRLGSKDTSYFND